MSNSMNVLNSEIQRIGSINAPAGAVTITVAESGTHFMCTPPGAPGASVTLPNPATAGLTYTFTKVGAVAQPIVFTLGAHVGTLIKGKADGTLGAALSGATSVTMATTAVVGDFLKITSTGTNWIVVACSNSASTAGFTSV